MSQFVVCFLFEYITFDDLKDVKDKELRNLELFEFKDVAGGMNFSNTQKDELVHIITGKYAGKTASVLLNSAARQKKTGRKYVAILRNFDEMLKANENVVDINAIYELMREKIGSKYYKRSGDGTSLSAIEAGDELEKMLHVIKKKEFDEDAFSKTSDIYSMYENIKKTIIAQDEPIMKILTSLFKNQLAINFNFDIDLIAKLKENLLICGSTGTGKTEIIKKIAKIYEIPMVIEDATTLSETGYQGRDVTNMLEDLYYAAGKDKNLAEHGILVIDEIDKISEKEAKRIHVSREGVQRSLLKLLDGSVFFLKDNMKFDTSRLTIIALGAFTGISETYEDLTKGKLVNYGLMSELVGRFSKIVTMNIFNKEDYKKIFLESDFSPLCTYKQLFDAMNISFECTDEFVDWLIDEAYKEETAATEKTGARCIKTKFDDVISGAMFKIFAGEYSKVTMVKPDEDGICYQMVAKEASGDGKGRGLKGIFNLGKKDTSDKK